MRTIVDLAAGDRTDELVLSNASFYNLSSVKLTGIGPAFSWTLYFAPGAAATPVNIVVVDSGEVPETIVAPHSAIQVVSLSLDCLQFLVPRDVNGVPFGLRVSTSGKAAAARLYLAWDGVSFFGGNTT